MGVERYRSAFTARRALTSLLADHTPVLLCIDQWTTGYRVGADATHLVVLGQPYDTVVRLSVGAVSATRRLPAPSVKWAPRLAWYDLHPLLARVRRACAWNSRPIARAACSRRPRVPTALDEYARQLTPFAAAQRSPVRGVRAGAPGSRPTGRRSPTRPRRDHRVPRVHGRAVRVRRTARGSGPEPGVAGAGADDGRRNGRRSRCRLRWRRRPRSVGR